MTPVKSAKLSVMSPVKSSRARTTKTKRLGVPHKTQVVKSLSVAPKKRATRKRVPLESASPKFIQTVGRRKRAIARLRFYANGTGAITINDKNYKKYFPYVFWQETVTEPLPLVGLANSVNIFVKVGGGGLSAQAEAIRLALARALIKHNQDWRPTLRKMGWLTRDPREKERKKPGLKRARRAPQWQKR